MVNLELSNNLHRDGIIGTAEQQGSETLAATTAHTQMALRMLDDGKAVQMTENLDMDITAYKLSQHLGDESIFAGYVAGSYDASTDYWKLNLEGEIEWDGSRDLNVEYRDEYGNVKIKHGHIKDDTGSFSQSLAKYVGLSRAQKILKLNLNDASSYDLQTLIDVLKIHPMMANALQRVDELPSIVTDTQREKLVGETLMKKHGMTWDIEKNAWIGGMEPIKLTDNSAIGQIVINNDVDGTIVLEFSV